MKKDENKPTPREAMIGFCICMIVVIAIILYNMIFP